MRADPGVEVRIVDRLTLFRISIEIDQVWVRQRQGWIGQRFLLHHNKFEIMPLNAIKLSAEPVRKSVATRILLLAFEVTSRATPEQRFFRAIVPGKTTIVLSATPSSFR